MKKVFCLLTLSLFVLSILTVSKASANEGPDRRDARGSRFRDANRSGLRDYDRHLEDRGRAAYPGGASGSAPAGGSAPLDGGISILLAAGIGLGVKKVIDRNKAAKQAVTDTQA
jgi:hypothetical protein